MKYSKKQKILLWILQIAAAGILLQSLFFKFTGASESIEIFSKLGVEPWGRYLVGTIELITSILLLSGRFSMIGAILGAMIMIGAITSHILVLGISDLFYLAIIELVLCLTIILMKKIK